MAGQAERGAGRGAGGGRRNVVNCTTICNRNRASLLGIPGLLEKLIKFISVPSVPSDELAVVDHMPRGANIEVEES